MYFSSRSLLEGTSDELARQGTLLLPALLEVAANGHYPSLAFLVPNVPYLPLKLNLDHDFCEDLDQPFQGLSLSD